MPNKMGANSIDELIEGMDNAAKLADDAEMLTKQAAISKRIEAIELATEAIKRYSQLMAAHKLFVPQVEQFAFNFITKNLFLIKQEMGFKNYQALLGEEGIKIEIYLKQLMSLLFDYQRCLSLNNRTQNLLLAFQKNPSRLQIDWQGFKYYKKNLNSLQSSFKEYKILLNERDFLKPLSEFLVKLKTVQLSPASNLLSSTPSNQPNPYENLKDLYALDRILFYLNLALSIDLSADKELSEAVIERSLQVIGEYFKSSKETPNLSSTMRQKLEALGIPVERISDLRDVLSHSGTFLFSVREKFQGENNQEVFKRIQTDLKKIKPIILKIIYRTELKQIKNLIHEVDWDPSIPPNILLIIKEIDSLQDLENIANKLGEIKKEIQFLNIKDVEKIDAIIFSIKLKNERKKIADIEKVNLEDPSLSSEIDAFTEQTQLAHIDELDYFKNYHVIPSKSSITSLSETDGISELTLTPKQIPLAIENFDLLRLYEEFIKVTFKNYESHYRQLSEKKNLPLDENLLTLEIETLLRDIKLPKNELKDWIDIFKLMLKLDSIKSNFISLLKEVKYGDIKTINIYLFLINNKLEINKLPILQNLLFDFNQSLLFNRIFSNYLEDFLQEVKIKLSTATYAHIFNKLKEKKELREAKLRLIDFIDNKFIIATQKEYNRLVDSLKILNPLKKQKIESGFVNKSDLHVKKYIEEVQDHYTAFLNRIKKSVLTFDVQSALEKLIKALDLNKHIENSLLNNLNNLANSLENKRLEKFFTQKMAKLKKLTENYQHLPEMSEKLKAAREMLLLDLSAIWSNLEKISDPSIKKFSPEACLLKSPSFINYRGFSLRNYLAHGNVLFDILQPNFWQEIRINLEYFAADANNLLILKRLLEDPAMNYYLLQTIASGQGLDETALPSALQFYRDNLKEFKTSPQWKSYLEQLNPQRQASTSSEISAISYQKGLRQIFTAELREAAARNDLPKLKYLCASNIDVDSKDEKGWSATFYAVAENSFAALQELKDRGAKLDSLDNTGGMLIHYASIQEESSSSLLNVLLQADGQLINKRNNKGFTPLYFAVIMGNEALVKKLLDSGADIHQADKGGWTPCLVASSYTYKNILNLLVDQLKALKQYQPESDLINKKNGWSALMVAATDNNIAIATELLRYGARIDHTAKVRWSALHIASFKGNQDFIQLLCERGANLNIKGEGGARPLHLVAQQGHVASFEFLWHQPNLKKRVRDIHGRSFLCLAVLNQQLPILKKFIELQVDKEEAEKLINLADNSAHTPLHLAAEIGNLPLITFLLENKANPNLKNKKGLAPSHIAAFFGYLDVIKLFKEHGANFELRAHHNWAHLHLAASEGHRSVVNYLLENNLAKVKSKTGDGFTALHLAAAKGHLEVIKCLYSTLIDINILSDDGQTAAYVAVRNGQLSTLKFLHEKGANLKLAGPNNWDLLNVACYSGYPKIVNYLLAIEKKLNLKAFSSPKRRPLHLAAAAGNLPFILKKRPPDDYLKIIKILIAKGANILEKNSHDYVLHQAVLSDNREIIHYLVQEIKKVSPATDWDALFIDNEGDTPLIWAAQEKKLNSIQALIEVGSNVQYKNPHGKSALDFVLDENYQALIRNKNPKQQRIALNYQQKIIKILYLANYAPQNLERMHKSFDRFTALINEEIRNYLFTLSLEEIIPWQKKIKEQGLSTLWPRISATVEKRLLTEFSDVYLTPSGETTLAFKDLLRHSPWVKLDSLSLKILENIKKAASFAKLQTQLSAPLGLGCEAFPTERERRAISACENSQEKFKYHPFVHFNENEKNTAILTVVSATPSQRERIFENLHNIHAIKAERKVNQSPRERQKLAIFREITKTLLAAKSSYFRKAETIDQAQLIEISDWEGRKTYLAIQQALQRGIKTLHIYSPEINGNRALAMSPEFTLIEVIVIYGSLLFPEALVEELAFQYYCLEKNHFSLQESIQQIISEDFRTDTQLLKEGHNLLAGLDVNSVRQLFFFNGHAPNLNALHEAIFADPRFEITLRSDKLLPTLWNLPPSQQIALGKILTRYAIPEVRLTEHDAKTSLSIKILRQQLIKQLKAAAVQNKMFNQNELIRFAEDLLQQKLLNHHFNQEEITEIINNTHALTKNLGTRLNTLGLIRQGIFLAPAILQAFNGDSQGLKNMTMMMGGDIAIDQLYQKLISDARFVKKFAKIAALLQQSSLLTASPISKILLLHSFAELAQQIKTQPADSPEIHLATALLTDNSIFFTVMLAEILGLELGPGGIFIDLGIMLHQLVASAIYIREKLPFKLSFWRSFELSLGFKKEWLDVKFEKYSLYSLQLRLINELSERLQKPFSYVLLSVPGVKEIIHGVDFHELPKEIQTAITDNPEQAINDLEIQYVPPAVIYRKYPEVKKPPQYKMKSFIIQASKATVFMLNTTENVSQESSIFRRTRKVCQETFPLNKKRKRQVLAECFENPSFGVRLCGRKRKKCYNEHIIVAENWLVSASTTMHKGSHLAKSPIQITGGLGALMKNNNVTHGDKNKLLVNFNSCFGDLALFGGDFLANKTLYVLINNIMMNNLLDPSFHFSVPEFNFSNCESTQQVIYLVGSNFHPSKIKAPVAAIQIFLLPLESSRLKHLATNITTQDKELRLGDTGPRFDLEGIKSLTLNFPQKDYFLSGLIRFEGLSIQLEEVRSDDINPPCFFLSPQQSLSISLRQGQIYFEGSPFQLSVKIKDNVLGAPRLLKASNAPYIISIEQPLNNLTFLSNLFLYLSNTGAELAIKKSALESLVLQGNYVLEDNKIYQATLTVNNEQRSLMVLDVINLAEFLRQERFFHLIAKQGLSGVTLYNSLTGESQWVGFAASCNRLSYKGITYRFDNKHGLVAIQGRISKENPLQEDFSHAHSILIEANASFPVKTSKNSVVLGPRKLTKLPPAALLLTRSGLLPLQLLNSPKIKNEATANPSANHYQLPPAKLELCKTNFFQFDGDGLLNLALWAQGFFSRRKNPSQKQAETPPLSAAEASILAGNMVNKLRGFIRQCAQKAGIDYAKVSLRISFVDLRIDLAKAIEVKNFEKITKTLNDYLKPLASLQVKQEKVFYKSLTTRIDNYFFNQTAKLLLSFQQNPVTPQMFPMKQKRHLSLNGP